jgi:hypothetical protein
MPPRDRGRGAAGAAGAAAVAAAGVPPPPPPPPPSTGAEKRAERAAAKVAKAALAPLAPLLAALHAARKPAELLRAARAVELYERALVLCDDAVAAGTLPADSFILATVVHELVCNRMLAAELALASNARPALASGAGPPSHCQFAARARAWRTETRGVSLSQRQLATLTARWNAGTLFTLAPAERAFCEEEGLLEADSSPSPHAAVANLLFWAANDAAFWWPCETQRDERETARVCGVTAALRALASLVEQSFARGRTQHTVVNGRIRLHLFRLHDGVAPQLSQLLHHFALDEEEAPLEVAPQLHALRAVGGLTAAEEQTLRVVAQPFVEQQLDSAGEGNAAELARLQARADADMARHALRGCALPACAATEPHPQAFKLCSRCKTAVYCCKAHQAEDWKRHKREDCCNDSATEA